MEGTRMTTLRDDRELDALAAEKLGGYVWYAFGKEQIGGPWRVLSEPTKEGETLFPGFYPATGDEPLSRDAFREVPKYTKKMGRALTLADALHAKDPSWGWQLTSLLDWPDRPRQYRAIVSDQWRKFQAEDTVPARAFTVACILAAGANPYTDQPAP
jgi:hypothetical protein